MSIRRKQDRRARAVEKDAEQGREFLPAVQLEQNLINKV